MLSQCQRSRRTCVLTHGSNIMKGPVVLKLQHIVIDVQADSLTRCYSILTLIPSINDG